VLLERPPTCYNVYFVETQRKRIGKGKVKVARKNKTASEKKTGEAKTKKPRLSDADLEHFRQILLDKRQEIIGNVNEMKDEALNKSRLDASGDLSSMPIHMADLGTDTYDQEFALGLMDSERKLLREIDDALQRIEDHTYGICEGTGKPISKARLEAQPWARYCVEYARMLEQGQPGKQEQ
jgi:RNA polymerase-binding protein DksA